jgi:hypothetical protein
MCLDTPRKVNVSEPNAQDIPPLQFELCTNLCIKTGTDGSYAPVALCFKFLSIWQYFHFHPELNIPSPSTPFPPNTKTFLPFLILTQLHAHQQRFSKLSCWFTLQLTLSALYTPIISPLTWHIWASAIVRGIIENIMDMCRHLYSICGSAKHR